MSLTIANVNKSGRFDVVAPNGSYVGYGRAVASKSHPGMVMLTFSRSVLDKLGNGPNPHYAIRVPADWTSEITYADTT